MSQEQIEAVLTRAEREGVAFVDLQFTDFLGNLKNCTIPSYRLKEALLRGVWIDGSSIEGFARIHESDMFLMPDSTTYALLPWRNSTEGGKVARLICDVYKPNHEPFEGDPRNILKRVLAEAQAMGFEYYTGPEVEFFLFPRDASGKIVLESKGNGYYFNLVVDEAHAIKREIMSALSELGICSESATYEVANNQHEIDLHYDQALKTADNTITLKMAAKFIAFRHNFYASFMPKPFHGINGSAMHTHQSLWRDGVNAFYDPTNVYGLSQTALQFLAGQLAYAREIAAVFAPTVNSYKRLTPGYEAPVYICWARINRSALIRVPQVSRGYEETATRLEIRSPDPSSNPYLTFAVLLKAGLEGIKQGLEAPKPVEEDVYGFDDARLQAYYIHKLPGSLEEALHLMEQGTIVRQVMGEYTFQRYLEAKRQEWDAFRTHVTDWELNRYLEVL